MHTYQCVPEMSGGGAARAHLLMLAALLVFAVLAGLDCVAVAQDFHSAPPRSTVHKILGKYKPKANRAQVQRYPQPFVPIEQQKVETDTPFLVATKIAAVGLALAGFLVFISFRLFSPSGWLSNRAKADYIPTQFKSQHHKYVQALSKAARSDGLPMGIRAEGMLSRIKPTAIALPKAFREDNPHMLVIGSGGKGKSQLLANLIRYDIERGQRAIVVVDSEGGLVDLLISEISSAKNADELRERIVLVDPVRRSGEITAYDPLKVSWHQDPQIVANNVVLGFKAIYQDVSGRPQQDQWNAQTANILRNALMLLIANGRTIADLPALLSENDFRDILLQNLERHIQPNSPYITVLDAWAQYRRLARTDQWITWVEPILNRVQPALSDIRIRTALTGGDRNIDLTAVIEEKKILLVRLPQGQLDPSANLLGSLIITGLRQAAVCLNTNEFAEVTPCALYVDELDKFVDSETFGFISTESRRYQIGITGTMRTLQGLPEMYRNQILANIGTLCTFALGRKDAELLGPQMFRVDGRKYKHRPIQAFFNPIGTSPQFELITDEEKLNVDRLIGLERCEFFCYRVGTIAGVLKLRTHKRATKDSSEKPIIRYRPSSEPGAAYAGLNS